jgi:hypothetical protein
MVASRLALPVRVRLILAAIAFPIVLEGTPALRAADSAYVRVNQVGYEADDQARAYLMSTAAETGAASK